METQSEDENVSGEASPQEEEEEEDMDEFKFGADSQWHLDTVDREVCLKKAPEVVRIPLSLFKKLYPFQREGVAWIAGHHLNDTGGILGE